MVVIEKVSIIKREKQQSWPVKKDTHQKNINSIVQRKMRLDSMFTLRNNFKINYRSSERITIMVGSNR